MGQLKLFSVATLCVINCCAANTEAQLEKAEKRYDLYLRVLNEEVKICEQINSNGKTEVVGESQEVNQIDEFKKTVEKERETTTKTSVVCGGVMGLIIAGTFIWILQRCSPNAPIYSKGLHVMGGILVSALSYGLCANVISSNSFSGGIPFFSESTLLHHKLNAITNFRKKFISGKASHDYSASNEEQECRLEDKGIAPISINVT